ncbi:tetratricopeptide repeat protein [Dissulfurirhabdus thermomarina]|uniref:Tetratricopeptide repeat protein n=1 Tax=Dissulfurirhabdus thermomarina TaxID=1765737 RepID=A0A6N9TVH6_DISTH|nr:YcaO-like family protein [Dissulfurirhabdus thermomarina]NDY42496.1 tetratricopeptide repeat protein [Dissulfurirhabdus thermomarina]NMX24184.1 tetratricopeptide repeat protein [Dissulfurirhabdus thermomarina]
MLHDSYKESGAGYDKVCTPEETLRWVRERFRRAGLPVLRDVERIDKGRLGIPVYVSLYAAEATRLTGTAKQMGKGATPAQAECSAVMELVERYSLFSFLREGRRPLARWSEVDGRAVSKEDLFRALHDPLEEPGAVARAEELLDLLPLEWVTAYDPLARTAGRLPWSWFWPINEYNGSAAGNSLAEAAVQALSEVVERHVCSLVTFDRRTTPTIDPASVRGETARGLLRCFERVGVEVHLKDFSLGYGIPTVGAIAWDPATFPRRSEIVYTAGTSPDPERALIRALTEVAQLAGDFDTDGKYVESGLPLFATLDEAGYVLEAPAVVGLDALPSCASRNFREEVERAAADLLGHGLPVRVVDVTHPALGVPVTYVVAPGTHFRDRTRGVSVAYHGARVAAALPDPRAALAVLDRIEALYPESYEAAFYRGHAMERAGDYSAALRQYEKALALGPAESDRASVHCHRGLCHKELGDYARAEAELELARDLNPGLKEVHNLLGFCRYKQGRYLEAVEAFEAAVALDPASAIDYANIGTNLRMLGLAAAARRWYEMALEIDPDLDLARQGLAKLAEAA